MKFTSEDIQKFVDGELPPAKMEAIRIQIKTDSELAREVKLHEEIDQAIMEDDLEDDLEIFRSGLTKIRRGLLA